MPHQSALISLANFPVELIIKIFSHLVPNHVGALRQILIACRNTDHKCLCIVVEQILNAQRLWLLNRWNKIWEEKQANHEISPDRLASIGPIARRIIGKQYVDDTELIDERGSWAIKKSDLNIEKIRIYRKAHCYPDIQMEGPTDYDVDSPIKYKKSKCKGQPWDGARLNIEVGFLPYTYCPEGRRASTWKRSGPNQHWQFVNGICIDVRWG